MGIYENNKKYRKYEKRGIIRIRQPIDNQEKYDCWEMPELSELLLNIPNIRLSRPWKEIDGTPLYFSYKCVETRAQDCKIGFQINTYAYQEFHEWVGENIVPRIEKALKLKLNPTDRQRYTKCFEWAEDVSPSLTFDLVMKKVIPAIKHFIKDFKDKKIEPPSL